MAKVSKRIREIREAIEPGQHYPVTEAVDLLNKLSRVRFTESIDVAVNLGVDPRKSDQNVRGASVLPHGTGKTVRVAVFAQGDKAEEARQAGADVVGLDDLAEQVQQGEINFDVVVAAPDAMRVVGKLGTILGPRGLMPNPKVGTVTNDIAEAVENAKGGQVRYRTDKGGVIHCTIGQVGFGSEAIKENLETLINDLKKAKPSTAKGQYLKKITLSSTMGPGLFVDQSSLAI